MNVRETILIRKVDCAEASYTPVVGDEVTGYKDRYGNTIASDRLYVTAIRVVAAGPVSDAFLALDLSDDAPARRSA